MNMDATCPICCSEYTKVIRRVVECSYCNHQACLDCVKKYILNVADDPNCMKCHVLWNRDFLDLILTKAFRMGEYKEHREKVLLDREKSLLVETMVDVEREKQKREMAKIYEDLAGRKQELMRELQEVKDQMMNIRYNKLPKVDVSEKKTFIRSCVMTECRGFLSSQWKCAVCATWVCPDCQEPKTSRDDPTHTCDPSVVESVKMIAKDSKPCPKCTSMIFKIAGCSQIWCTECHCTFDWNTGREVVGQRIHNPHYYEWLRKQNGGVLPRNVGDIPLNCGGLPHMINLNKYVAKYAQVDKRIVKISRLHRLINHIIDIEIRPLNWITPNDINTNRDLRLSYLLGEISEEKWKRDLQKREKKREFAVAKRNVFEMFVTAGTDILNKMVLCHRDAEIIACLDEGDNLIAYFNDSVLQVMERFNSKTVRRINEDWSLLYKP